LSVLRLVEALVLAHVDLTLGSLDVVDPDNHDMLRSGFAF